MTNSKTEADHIGARIRAAREEKGLSQSDLARALGFKTATAISLIESGERGVPAALLQRLGEVLQRDVKYFLGEEDKIDIQVALRADKDLTKEDKDAILRFIELAKRKSRKDGK